MFGPGRPTSKPEVTFVGPLSREDLDNFAPEVTAIANKVVQFRDSHHMLARLFAMGLRPGEVAQRVGYSLTRVSTLRADPAFQELIAVYRKDVDTAFRENADEYFETIASNRIIAARRLNDLLTDDDREFTPTQLVAIHADAADRTGYPKRSVAVNVNVDFAARLDKAIAKSAQVRLPAPLQGSAGGGGPEEAASPAHRHAPPPEPLTGEVIAPLRRRA